MPLPFISNRVSCKLYNYLFYLPLTFWEVACKIYAVWCTLPQCWALRFIFIRRLCRGMRFAPCVGVYVMRNVPGTARLVVMLAIT